MKTNNKTSSAKTLSNKRPCEVCGVYIKATKGNDLCKPCADHMKLFDHLWRVTHEQETVE